MKRRSGNGNCNAGRRLKKAQKEGRTIVFIDESGLSERPHRCRTWAPRGQTPVLPYHFNWKVLSAMAGVTWWNFYFRLFPGTIRSPQVIEFLAHLLRHIPVRSAACRQAELFRKLHPQPPALLADELPSNNRYPSASVLG